jgi:hypothetical protein
MLICYLIHAQICIKGLHKYWKIIIYFYAFIIMIAIFIVGCKKNYCRKSLSIYIYFIEIRDIAG